MANRARVAAKKAQRRVREEAESNSLSLRSEELAPNPAKPAPKKSPISDLSASFTENYWCTTCVSFLMQVDRWCPWVQVYSAARERRELEVRVPGGHASDSTQLYLNLRFPVFGFSCSRKPRR